MKKFKIKNRQKRKYVKKSDLASSLSSVQSFTVGLVPLVLMAIAFFTTVIMYNPPIKSLPNASGAFHMPAVPVVDLPKINFTFTIPEMPKIVLPEIPKLSLPSIPSVPSMPKITLPKIILPKIVLPNFGTGMLTILSGIANTVGTSVQTIIKVVDIIEIRLTVFALKTAALLDPRPLLISSVQGVISLIQKTLQTLSSGIVLIQVRSLEVITHFVDGFITSTQKTVHTLQETSKVLLQFTIHAIKIIITWLQNLFSAIIKAVNDFIWFLGTPFRVIGQYAANIHQSLLPFYNWMGRSLENTKNELSIGGNNLMKGSAFVGSAIDKNYQEK